MIPSSIKRALTRSQELELTERAIRAEMTLAVLLGWTEVRKGGVERGITIPDRWISGYPPGSDKVDREMVPRWGRDDGDAFRLGLDLGIHHALRRDGSGWAEHLESGAHYFEFSQADDPVAELRFTILRCATSICRAGAEAAPKNVGETS